MKRVLLHTLLLMLLYGCDNSRWETIRGNGIDDEPKSIARVIYFENENNGLVGGFTLLEDKNSKTPNGLVTVPTLFLTENRGRDWEEIKFDSNLRTAVDKVFLQGNTLICYLKPLLLFSSNKGKSFQTITDSLEKNKIIEQYFRVNRYDIKDHDFIFKDKNYHIKERYKNDLATVIVCYGEKTMTDYYFVSFDNEKSWTFLQESFGNNRARYLLADKFLYSYDFPFGLQRLKLK